MRRHVVLLSLVACSSPGQEQRLDAPMVDIPVATSSATTPPPPKDDRPRPAVIATGSLRTELAVKARDPRRARLQARAAALLTTELDGLERLLAATPQGAADRPALLRRLAEDYVELSRSRARDGIAGAGDARDKAIEHYKRIHVDHPTYAQLDEVLYYLGIEQELAGKPKEARLAYYDLIRQQPQSKFVPAAYFAFGELFYEEGKSDPSKYALAEQAYLETIKYPAPQNFLFADALLRLGQVAQENGSQAKASQYFSRLKRDFPGSEAAQSIP